jgi:hypothetical protein
MIMHLEGGETIKHISNTACFNKERHTLRKRRGRPFSVLTSRPCTCTCTTDNTNRGHMRSLQCLALRVDVVEESPWRTALGKHLHLVGRALHAVADDLAGLMGIECDSQNAQESVKGSKGSPTRKRG